MTDETPAHLALLDEARSAIADRQADYGSPAETYERASAIASLILNHPITPHDIAIVMHSVKLARISESIDHKDSYVDGISYLAFAGEFARAGHISVKRMATMIPPDPPRMVPVDSRETREWKQRNAPAAE